MLLIIGEKYGALGNRLFLFAHFIANAVEYNYDVYNPAFDEYAQYFKNIKNNVIISYPNNDFSFKPYQKLVGLSRKFSYLVISSIIRFFVLIRFDKSRLHEVISISDNETLDLNDIKYVDVVNNKKIVVVNGWLYRDNNNLYKHSDVVKKYFELDDVHENNINCLIQNVRNKCDVLVGIHIRLGDYKTFENGKYYYNLDVYKKAMCDMSNLFPNKNVHFIICSNEIIEKNTFTDHKYASGTGNIIEDMYSFTKCDYIIGPPSTYTIWASFYGNVPLYFIESPELKITIDGFKTYNDLLK